VSVRPGVLELSNSPQDNPIPQGSVLWRTPAMLSTPPTTDEGVRFARHRTEHPGLTTRSTHQPSDTRFAGSLATVVQSRQQIVRDSAQESPASVDKLAHPESAAIDVPTDVAVRQATVSVRVRHLGAWGRLKGRFSFL
jgi:hypothetical protein